MEQKYTIYSKLLWMVFGLLTSVCTLSAQTTGGEPTYNSPYSILGLGDLSDQQFAINRGMGGLSAAFHDPYHLNLLNPASLGWLRSTSFEAGVFGRYANLTSSNGQTDEVWNGNLNYLALGFTLRNPINESLDRIVPNFGIGMMISLTPYSTVSYDIQVVSPLDEINSVGSFQGTGGTYRLNWGTGFRYKTFSGGVNLGYLFGRINNDRQVLLDDLSVHYFDDFSDAINVNGLLWNIGFGYDLLFESPDNKGEVKPNGKKLSFGLYGNSSSGFNTRSDKLYRRVYSINSQTLPQSERSDTILNSTGVSESGTLPASFTFGVMYEDENKIRLGVEYSSTLWNNYENLAKPDQLDNNYRLSIGGEWIPDHLSYNRYLKRVRYRLGAFYQNDPRSFDGEQLTNYGVTAGLGFPLVLPRQQTSFINFAVEAGKFGLDQAISENYIKLTLGFTLNDNSWFFKRKFE